MLPITKDQRKVYKLLSLSHATEIWLHYATNMLPVVTINKNWNNNVGMIFFVAWQKEPESSHGVQFCVCKSQSYITENVQIFRRYPYEIWNFVFCMLQSIKT